MHMNIHELFMNVGEQKIMNVRELILFMNSHLFMNWAVHERPWTKIIHELGLIHEPDS